MCVYSEKENVEDFFNKAIWSNTKKHWKQSGTAIMISIEISLL